MSKKTITCLAFGSGGKFLATGECGHAPSLRIWNVQDGQQMAEFQGHKYGINCVVRNFVIKLFYQLSFFFSF